MCNPRIHDERHLYSVDNAIADQVILTIEDGDVSLELFTNTGLHYIHGNKRFLYLLHFSWDMG